MVILCQTSFRAILAAFAVHLPIEPDIIGDAARHDLSSRPYPPAFQPCHAMSDIDLFLQAATRENTRKSYQSALRDFEVEWGGLLPATPDSVARYLADRAGKHAVNTLRQRLAALAQWHLDQGFPDPTKAPVVRQVLRGIQTLHPAQEKRAKPFQIDQLMLVDHWLTANADAAQSQGELAAELRYRYTSR